MDCSPVRTKVGRDRCSTSTNAAVRPAHPAYFYAIFDEPHRALDIVPSVYAFLATLYRIYIQLEMPWRYGLDILGFMMLQRALACCLLGFFGSASLFVIFPISTFGMLASWPVSARRYIPSLACPLKLRALYVLSILAKDPNSTNE